MKLAVAIVVALLSTREAVAAPRQVLVFKLDGDADPAERARLQTELARLAADPDAVVTSGETTFGETASAVGCDPDSAACVELVRQTLAVDEIVYGRAKRAPDGRSDLELHRSRAAAPTRDEHASVAAGEPVVLGPPTRPRPAGGGEHARRNYAIALFVGSGVAILIGATLWSDAGHKQDQIDAHPDATLAQVQDLVKLEDRATTSARFGNVLMLVGLGLGAAGGYVLYEDRKATRVTVGAAPMASGAAVTLGGAW